MRTTHARTALALVGAASLLLGGSAYAGTADVTSLPPPEHVGPPELWGPLLEVVCTDPAIATAMGYFVIEGDNLANTIVGGPSADAIFGYGGNDQIAGGAGNDILCGGYGHDLLVGELGKDAMFGGPHDDTLRGQEHRDYLDGDGQTDQCNGGIAADAATECETVLLVP